MDCIVTKFGGSSLADANQFKKVKEIVFSDSKRRFVVPSAPGKRHNKDYKITDLLYLCHAHVESSIPFDDVFKLISDRYKEIVTNLEMDLNIDDDLNTIKKNLENGFSRDYAASRGEYLNGLILAKYLGYEFIDPAEFIIFDKSKNLDSEKTNHLIKTRLSNVEKAVIPGFYGANSNGDIITFSRGGSDITGSLISAGIEATLYENWTDVSGFLMADPRIVDNPKTIEKITYRELRELSYMGASVLHEEAIFPVRKNGIPINIKNTNIPEDIGTFIIKDFPNTNEHGTITGIAGKKDFTVISVEKALMNYELGFCRKLLSILENHSVSFENMPAGIDTVCLVVSDNQIKDKLQTIVKEIEVQCSPDAIHIYPNMALIATVGRGMAKTRGIASKIFTALSDNGINIRMIDQGSSEINILVGIENDDFEKAIQSIYNVFV